MIAKLNEKRFTVRIFRITKGQQLLHGKQNDYYVTVFDKKKPGYENDGGGYTRDPLTGILPQELQAKLMKMAQEDDQA